MKHLTALCLCLACTARGGAAEVTADTLDTHEMKEITVSTGMKQFGALEAQPMSAQKLSPRRLRSNGMESLKSMALTVPNLFYPEYGSRLTPAIYIRGIGSRANTPVVGMYVDDVAMMEKSSFDFSMDDAERVEVLRGPQSTLYGRNAMGGLIRVYTPSPLDEGRATEFRISTAAPEGMRHMYARHSNLLGEGLGMSVSGFYRGDNGYNRNDYLNRRSNGSEAGGARLRLAYSRRPQFALDFRSSGEYSDEDAYDYVNTTNNRIETGMLGGYRRTLFNSSLKMSTEQRRFSMTAVTAYQYLKDRMTMDQDYLPEDLFRLMQRQRSHSLSEEVVFKGSTAKGKERTEGLVLDWTAGGYFGYQTMRTDAPVVFGQEGIATLIQPGIDRGFASANAEMGKMGMSLALNVTDPTLTVDGNFDTPVLNTAAFGQLQLKNILARGLDLTAGVRLDYERREMEYLSGTTVHSHFLMQRQVAPAPVPPVVISEKDFRTASGYEGKLNDRQKQVLPRVALSYRWDREDDGNLVYVCYSEGLRSGGYNIQMFSELIQASLRNDMMRDLAADPKLGPMFSQNMPPVGENPSADSATVYRPERSRNYEAGVHLSLFNKRLTASAAVFCITVSDQQITRLAVGNGLGRQVLNAGKSRSCGMELSLSGRLYIADNPLQLTANYAYTNATFTDYDAGTADYAGNHLPFAPRHSVSASADYLFPIKSVIVDLGVNTTGQGRTYWTEDNQYMQPYYQLLGAHVGARCTVKQTTLSLTLWATNLAGKDYTPFLFISRGQAFAQTGQPRRIGATLNVRF